MPSLSPFLRNTFILLLAVVLGFGFGVGVARHPEAVTDSVLPDWLVAAAPESATDVELFRQVWNKIKSSYVDSSVTDHQLISGAIQGLVGSLNDPYTAFLPPDEAKDFQDEVKGTFEGVGMEVGMKNNVLTIIAPLSDSPAEKAGIRAGDMIVSIDGVDAQSLTLNQAVKKIRGPQGTTVTLIIQRGAEQPRTVKVTRQTIHVSPVSTKFETRDSKQFAIIRISSFSQEAEQKFRQAAVDALNKNVAGFVIDLRNDPGGYLDQSIGIASAFISSGPIVSEVDRQGRQRTLEAKGSAILSGQKIVILVNGGSASASEIVAGALQDTKTATIIGEQTYGKGTVQQLEELSGGANLKLTVAKWLTPNGSSITDHGITPDIIVKLTAEDDAAGRDPQLAAALEHLLKS